MHIVLKNIHKSFGTNKVLDGAGFELKEGEVHALMGENGAGKSTLMKILTGVYEKDSGEVLVDGQEVCFKSPKDAEKKGIVFVYQELNVIHDMTVQENFFLGKEIKYTFNLCAKREMYEKSKEALEKLNINILPNQIVGDLSIGQQQMIEICKALMINAKVIIMDEPTAALTESETKVLFETIKELKEKGVSIIYISHRMEEIFQICDRITVMRDGQFIDTKKIQETSMNDIVKMMIGREIGERYPKRESKIGEEILKVSNLAFKNVFQNISFNVKKGEILGVSGLMGAGRTEIMKSIFGEMPYDKGKVEIEGKEVSIKKPIDAIECGIGFITEDRKDEGLMLEKSIKDNIGLLNFMEISRKGFIKESYENSISEKAIDQFNIKCFDNEHICENLSGGNQQKVVLAKWIYRDPKILILDEPTRGVDVGAKKEIYTIINQLAEKGMAIIMVSSDLPEVIGVSDRVMVMREGKLAGILDKEKCSQENIMILATGGKI